LKISGENFRALVSGKARGVWPTFCRAGLQCVSVPYGWAIWYRNRLYDRGWKRSFRAGVPVVSVGNLTLGGTGKTPCVEYVARFFREQDRRLAILSRGYGGEAGRNDEALVLQENLPDVPHLQGADRVALARRAVEELESEVLVLDDGFQHRRLARDLDIVLVDASDPWGYGHLFPRGFLRERPSALGRAGIVFLTRCDQADAKERDRLREEIGQLAPGVPIAETRHRPVELVNSNRICQPVDNLANQPVAAFCGIGNPEAFRKTLTGLGSSVLAFKTYSDHHLYSQEDVEDLRNWAQEQERACLVMTTQKDLVKLRLTHLGNKELWALRIGLQVEKGQEVLNQRLQGVISRDEG
jgi:tetraacyldisaccharide 4'-kinase